MPTECFSLLSNNQVTLNIIECVRLKSNKENYRVCVYNEQYFNSFLHEWIALKFLKATIHLVHVHSHESPILHCLKAC